MGKKAGTLMVQGTASDSGKSFLAAALCRIFARRGIKTTPFKGWNMSLNSYITAAGAEIGTAQALQARAAYTKAHADMQPILIKPMGDGQSQIIISGKAAAVVNYQQQKEDYLKIYKQTIKNSLKRLRENNELVIIEGAGSPVEINRTTPDFANMFTAEIYNSPVILISSIEKGGSLAALVGTLKLLPPEHRALVKGLIINKFRGDFKLLQPALEFLESYTKKELIGVLPYLKNINLPEEDSASLRQQDCKAFSQKIKIAIIRLPHISNFTDFNSLKMEEDVYLEYLEDSKTLVNFDLIIIPGTKTTTKDLIFLKKSGLAAAIIEAEKKGVMIIGICGGFQMLGRKIIDKHETEASVKKINGLALLEIDTEFLQKKTTHQVEAVLNNQQQAKARLPNFDFNEKIKGYEIHMGQTKYLKNTKALFKLKQRSNKKVNLKDGAVNQSGSCFGTYLHGIFDNDNFRAKLLQKLKKNRKIDFRESESSSSNYEQKIEKSLDRAADIVEQRIDVDKLLKLSRR